MSTSIVTMSGSSACTLCSASMPLRAVPATRNSPPPDSSMICEMSRRMNALSSTTSTLRTSPSAPAAAALDDTISLLEGANLHAPVAQVEVYAAPVVAADVFRDDRHAALHQCLTSRDHIALADVDAPTREQAGEHARAADELRAHTARVGAEPRHLRQQQRDRRCGKLRGIRAVARHRLARQQHMREPAHPGGRIIQDDRHA